MPVNQLSHTILYMQNPEEKEIKADHWDQDYAGWKM